jgi:hypothetical protein
MRWPRALAVAAAPLCGCASPDADTQRVALCGPLEAQAELPATCAPGELDEFSKAVADHVERHARSALVRVTLDEASRVRALCVEDGPGYGPGTARRELAAHVDAILALPPGPTCAAGKRLDLNRYEAKWAEVRERETRCGEQTRVTRETHGPTVVRDRTVAGEYGVYDREVERCMEYEADWIVLDAPGSTRPWIYVKPEVPDPPGPSAYDTASRCTRRSNLVEKQAACIESEGWERLTPPH